MKTTEKCAMNLAEPVERTGFHVQYLSGFVELSGILQALPVYVFPFHRLRDSISVL